MDKPFSIIVPSRSQTKLQLAGNLWGRALSDLGTSDFPFMPVMGAGSMSQAYNTALSNVATEYAVFSHDDTAPLSFPRYFIGQRLLERMRNVDILGFCGSDKFCGASWQASGSLYGQVINHSPIADPPDANTVSMIQSGMRPCSVAVWQRPARLVRGIRVGDGYCIVARVEALKKLGGFWTPDSCSHYHHYDTDLFLRASEAGLRTALATDIYITHASVGSYGQPEWAAGIPEFFERWKGKADPNLGIASIHATIHCNDSRIALIELQSQERFMTDEVTL
jgi:hypothetical protein